MGNENLEHSLNGEAITKNLWKIFSEIQSILVINYVKGDVYVV